MSKTKEINGITYTIPDWEHEVVTAIKEYTVTNRTITLPGIREGQSAMIHFNDDYSDWNDVNEEFKQKYCEHEAVETGFRRTWCKRCNIDLEIVNGYVVVVEKPKKDSE